MALSVDHITRFIIVADVPREVGTSMRRRAQAAAKEFGYSREGVFAEGKLGRVIGDLELVHQFNELWESGRLN